MRISDWSSDVCSSDLGNVRELENRIKRAVIMAEASHLNPSDLDLAEAADEDFLNLRAARERADRSAIRMALSRRIGKASCREQVCQDVYNSMVAVALNKKKQS